MPLPLLWIGASVAGLAIAKGAIENAHKRDQQKRSTGQAEGFNSTHRAVAKSPCDWLTGEQKVTPVAGSIVSCGIYNALDHSGIWTSDNLIVELNGNGLVRAISPQRFLDDRSGENIFVASDSVGSPLVIEGTEQRALSQIYNYKEYHLVKNNCHKFSWSCISGEQRSITTFSDLNQQIARLHGKTVYWDLIS